MSAATALSRSFGGLSASLKQEVMVTTQRQGIVSILGNSGGSDATAKSSPPPPPPPLSLRRTLSADMSSSAWQLSLASPLKKIASSNELRGLEESDRDRDDAPAAGLCDTWSAIMSAQKSKEGEEDKDLSPPYIHPLVRQSKSCCLSEKSLEICTESLGSETGSEGFSSAPPSEAGEEEEQDAKEEENVVQQPTMQKFDMEDLRIAKLNNGVNFAAGCGGGKKSLPRSFPPPIPSLARGAAATETLHMRPHRDNGRLVLEAVSCASRNNFRAQREDGRLVLTFVPTGEPIAAEIDQFEVELENQATENLNENDDVGKEMDMDSDEEEEEETEEEENKNNKFVKEEAPKLSSGLASYHRLAVILNKPISRNQTWPIKTVESDDPTEQEEEATMKAIAPLTQSLPPRPPKSTVVKTVGAARKEAAAANVAAASSFNAYECGWKSKPMPTSSILGPTKNVNIINDYNNNNNPAATKFGISNSSQRRGDYFVPLVKGCKEPRRSLLFWEPYCIATS